MPAVIGITLAAVGALAFIGGALVVVLSARLRNGQGMCLGALWCLVGTSCLAIVAYNSSCFFGQ